MRFSAAEVTCATDKFACRSSAGYVNALAYNTQMCPYGICSIEICCASFLRFLCCWFPFVLLLLMCCMFLSLALHFLLSLLFCDKLPLFLPPPSRTVFHNMLASSSEITCGHLDGDLDNELSESFTCAGREGWKRRTDFDTIWCTDGNCAMETCCERIF